MEGDNAWTEPFLQSKGSDADLYVVLSCPACTHKVKQVLQSHEAVLQCHVALDGHVRLRFDPHRTTKAFLVTILRIAGFTVSEEKNTAPLSPASYRTEEAPVQLSQVERPSAPQARHDNQARKSVQASIAVKGMTCAACVATIENHVRSLDGVDHVQVSLLLHQAKVSFDPTRISKQGIVDEIDDIGFEAEVEETNAIKATVSIEGMSCASCVSKIENRIRSLNGIHYINVSLLLHEAQIEYDRQLISLDTIKHTITSLGYQVEPESTSVPQTDEYTALPMEPEQGTRLERVQRQEIQKWRSLLIISVSFALPIFLLAMVLPHINVIRSALMMPVYQGVTVMGLVLWLLCTPIQFGVGWTFYVGAYKALRHKSANMSVLVALGTSTAYIYSLLALVFGFYYSMENNPLKGSEHFFETSSTLITFVVLGKYLESLAKQRTSNALSKLLHLQPAEARLVRDGTERMVPVSSLQEGDVIKVLKGEKVPIDGTILQGHTYMNESMITGESEPREKKQGDGVIGACINIESPFTFQVTRIGDMTVLSQIIRLMESASMDKAPIQSFADTISAVFVPVVISLAVLTFIGWYAAIKTSVYTDIQDQPPALFALLFSIAVITVACPCALGLATPTAVMVGTGVGAKLGILIKGGGVLEIANKVRTVVFDKTGTLTAGKPVVTDLRLSRRFRVEGMDIERALYYAASAEHDSEHPIAQAVLSEAKRRSVALAQASNFTSTTGFGIECHIDDKDVILGNRQWLKKHGIAMDGMSERIVRDLESQGKTCILLALDSIFAAILGIADTPKPEAAVVVAKLQSMGKEVWMLTGDNQRTAKAIASKLGIRTDHVIAEALPDGKLGHVRSLQHSQNRVAFIGDGINDSPALAQADLGIAIASGSDVAIEAANMVLMRNSLFDIVTALDLSAVVFRRIKLNFLWALLFNVIGIPLAAGVLYPAAHIRLSPEVAAIAMASSSLLVLSSSLLLNYYSPPALGTQESSKHYDTMVRSQLDAAPACCSCSDCGKVKEEDLQRIYRMIRHISQGSGTSFSDVELNQLPDLSLCSCSCPECRCLKVPE